MARPKKEGSEIQNAEKRYSELVEKRDELNAEARACFDSRNALNDEKRRLYDEVQELVDQRRALGDEMNAHKQLRDEYQGAAKQLLESKKSKRGNLHRGLPEDIGSLKADIRLMEIRQETTPLSLTKERELLKEMETKRKMLEELQEKYGKQGAIVGELDDLDKSIDELFSKGDEEHKLVVALGTQMKEFREKLDAIRKEITHLALEAKKKHEEGLALREEASKIHLKAMDMREKLLAVKKERMAERRAKMAEVEEHNKEVRQSLGGKETKEKAADEALEELLKKGKIRMG